MGSGDLVLMAEDYRDSITFPPALTEAPEIGTHCYTPDLTGMVIEFTWYNTCTDIEYLESGIVHTSKISAELQKKSIIKLLTIKAV
jgi:hypothetical protein